MKQASKKIRVLVITPALNLCGGIESYAMNYYGQLKDRVKFDFITHEISDPNYKAEIENNGDKVYLMPPLKLGLVHKAKKQIAAFFKQYHDYDIVHCHMANAAFIYLKYAKKYGIKVRIVHSHNSKYADRPIHALRNIPLVKNGLRRATHCLACSEAAGNFLFKARPYEIVYNAINTQDFAYNQKTRKTLRKELGVEKDLVIGNVGRLVPQKNQGFLIRIFAQIHAKNKHSKLIIIGDGQLELELKSIASASGLQKDIIFLHSNNRIAEYMQAFDLLVLPSVYEGLGIVNIEAQASGLPVYTSTATPHEAKITDLIEFIPLYYGPERWAKVIMGKTYSSNKSRLDAQEQVAKSAYNIRRSADSLCELYEKFIRESSNE